MLHAARWKYRMQKWCKESPARHHRTTLSGYIFATKAYINDRKNLLSSNISCTYPHNMVTFGPLTAKIGSGVWGTSANFNGFRVLAALLHGTLVVGISQTCCVEQRAPPIFSRAVITLGIGPHSSFFIFRFPCDRLSYLYISFSVHIKDFTVVQYTILQWHSVL